MADQPPKISDVRWRWNDIHPILSFVRDGVAVDIGGEQKWIRHHGVDIVSAEIPGESATIGKNEGRHELYEDMVLEGSTRDPEIVKLTKEFLAATDDITSDFPRRGTERRFSPPP